MQNKTYSGYVKRNQYAKSLWNQRLFNMTIFLTLMFNRTTIFNQGPINLRADPMSPRAYPISLKVTPT